MNAHSIIKKNTDVPTLCHLLSFSMPCPTDFNRPGQSWVCPAFKDDLWGPHHLYLLAPTGQLVGSGLTADGRAVKTGSKIKSPFDMLINQFSYGTELSVLVHIENGLID